MAIADYATYKRKIEAAQMRGLWTKNSITLPGATGFHSSFIAAPDTGVAATATVRQCGRATAGNLFADQRNDLDLNTAPFFITDIEYIQPPNQSRPVAPVMLVDRLADVGGMSGIVLTAQPCGTGLVPSRYTNGVGVMAAVHIYTAVGTTATTLTISYTNQAGVAGQISKPIVFGATNNLAVSQILPIPLADGDSGVQSVQSATVLATTGTAGSFGITLYKPIAVMPQSAPNGRSAYREMLDSGAIDEISDDACLELWHTSLVATSSGIFTGRIGFVRGD